MNSVKKDELLDKIRVKLKENNPINWYWDYNDNISIKTIKEALEKAKNEGEYGMTAYQILQDDLWEMNIDNFYDMEIDAIHDVVKELIDEIAEVEGIDADILDTSKYSRKIREDVMDSIEIHMSIDELLRGNLNVRVQMYSNYDCFNSWYFEGQFGFSYESSYFGDIVNLLQLNPRTVERLLWARGYKVHGKWPNKSDIDKWVEYDNFFEEMENDTCPAGLFTIVGQVDTKDFLENYGKKGLKITIPKGNSVGMYSSWKGGGSIFECPLIRDVKITLDTPINGGSEYDHLSLLMDEEDKYNIKDVYEVTDGFFGKEIIINK